MAGAPGGFGPAGGATPAGGAGGAACGGGGAAGATGCGGGAAAGGGGGAGRGAAGGGGGAGLGGAGRGGAAAGGGAGRAGAGAAFGGCLGGCLGFPSGPSSSLACATTIGVVCACDGVLPNCIAVRAVVASSNKRSFVMMVWIPGKKGLATRVWQQGLSSSSGDQRTGVGPDCGGLQRRVCIYFRSREAPVRLCSLRIQGIVSNGAFTLFPAAYPHGQDQDQGAAPGIPAPPVSVAGDGVVGPCGPRTGNSSGVRPGNSAGLGDSPGSCIGGGTSGRGFPGGLSCGGSTGRPGLIGGSCCGSIGISRFRSFEDVPDPTAPMQQCSAAQMPKRAPAGCCCGSWRSRCSRVRACLRCSHPAIRYATDVRSPPRAATATAALP